MRFGIVLSFVSDKGAHGGAQVTSLRKADWVMKSGTALHEDLGYRWFRLWVLLGVGLALLLLVNSISNYFFVSRRVLVDQLRRDLASQVAGLERQIQQAGARGIQNVSDLIEKVQQKNDRKIAWIQIRDGDGAIVAHAGLARHAAFSMEFAHDQLRNRQPVFKTLGTEAGEVVVEAFPLRLPGGGGTEESL